MKRSVIYSVPLFNNFSEVVDQQSKMDNSSQNTLRRIEQNDNTLTRLFICDSNYDGEFISIDSSDR